MRPIRHRLTYANVVSTLCLFIVLGGSAWAAKSELAKNSVGTPQLKANAVTGAKVKNGSLTGADIDASSLGTVPKAASAESAANAGHATSADNAAHANSASSADHANSATAADHATSADTATQAGDAATLGGQGPGAFYPAGGIKRIDAAPTYNGAAVTLYSANGLVLTASCTEGGIPSATDLSIVAASSASGARLSVGLVERFLGSEKPHVAEYGIGPTPEPVWTTSGNTSNYGQSVGSMVYVDGERAIDITLETSLTTSRVCQVSGTAAVTG